MVWISHFPSFLLKGQRKILWHVWNLILVRWKLFCVDKMTNYTSYHSCDIILYPLLHGIHIITPFIWSTLWLRIYKQRNGRTSIICLFIHLFLAYIAKPFISTETPQNQIPYILESPLYLRFHVVSNVFIPFNQNLDILFCLEGGWFTVYWFHCI